MGQVRGRPHALGDPTKLLPPHPPRGNHVRTFDEGAAHARPVVGRQRPLRGPEPRLFRSTRPLVLRRRRAQLIGRRRRVVVVGTRCSTTPPRRCTPKDPVVQTTPVTGRRVPPGTKQVLRYHTNTRADARV